ncbi:hypothetical protein GW866_05420 [bacterium]|nr:hypothetical protein [bacterium]PIZ25828.1 MAG: hypothetical protein COY47_03860 [Chloroflexi bacterium CG_4_10_14_0_8_um_filter_57_5]
MKKHLLFLSLFIGFAIGLVGGGSGLTNKFHAHPVAAKSELRAISVSNANTTTSVPVPSVNAPTPLPVSNASVEQVIQNLNAKSISEIKSTWLHIQERQVFDTDLPNNGVLPNGMAIPNEQINDTWYHVNDQGLVIETVSIMRTTDGQVVQVGVSSNGTGWNSATDEIGAQEQFNLVGLDGGFLGDLMWLETFGKKPELVNITLPNRHPGVQVTILDKFDTPMKGDAYSKPAVSAETRATFDSVTGYLISKETMFWFEDGSSRVFSRVIQEITIESPTTEALSYLDEKERMVSK